MSQQIGPTTAAADSHSRHQDTLSCCVRPVRSVNAKLEKVVTGDDFFEFRVT
ncbi:hypothetical protein [Brevibacterium sp. CFH 10365]|uniref:hypothetical protein n=1 Tax=Brevibacterium sp. CFH 10365 TaxID=2585207 RepID=UPI00187925C2|nr:hypothetical protein [Brevibacterium sp. CFH 10365]